MALAIATNTSALMAAASATSVNKDMETSMQRLSTGQRINSAADDAAGTAIASRLSSEIRGTNQAIRNSMDGQALINTAEGAHQEIENILQRMRELAVQSANDTNDASDRSNLQTEVDQLLSEIDRIASATTWAGQTLLNGSSGTAENLATSANDTKNLSFHVGAGTSVRDSVAISIGATTSAALGVGGASSVPQLGGATVRGSADNAPASISVSDGTIAIRGQIENGDTFTFDVNGVEIEYEFDVSDGFANTLAGVSAGLTDAILQEIADGNLSAMTVIDNGDGSVSLSQSTVPTVSNIVITDDQDSEPDANISISMDNGLLTVGGSFANNDKISFELNGAEFTFDLDDDYVDGGDEVYEDTLAGVAAFLKREIDRAAEAGNTPELRGVTVVDNKDGTLTLSQGPAPVIEAAEVTPAFTPDSDLNFDNATTLTLEGDYKAGLEYQLELFGTKISIETSNSNGFSNDLDGVAEQLAQAINQSGIAGLKAEASGPDVELSGTPVISNFSVPRGDTDLTVDTDAGTIQVEDVAAGDLIRFSINGTEFEIKVATDGLKDDEDNAVAEQIRTAIADAGLAGVTVSRAADTVTVEYEFDAVNQSTSDRSLAVTNIRVSELPNASLSISEGTLSVDGIVNAGDTFALNLEGTDISVIAGSGGFAATKEGVAAQLASAINTAGIGGLSVTNNNDGTIDVGKVSVSLRSAEGAVSSIEAIDKAIQTLNTQRANLGAVSNRLDSTVSNLTNVAINLEGGKGRIEDADFAAESTNLAKSQILQQASTAMLAQANASKQNVLSLLQG